MMHTVSEDGMLVTVTGSMYKVKKQYSCHSDFGDLFNDTNQMHTYLLCIDAMFFLHVSLCSTPSSGRGFFSLLKTICRLYSYYLSMNGGCIINPLAPEFSFKF